MAAESLACFLSVIGCPSKSTSYMSFPSAHVKVTMEMNLNYHNCKPKLINSVSRFRVIFFGEAKFHILETKRKPHVTH
jgi:hypothetical protein